MNCTLLWEHDDKITIYTIRHWDWTDLGTSRWGFRQEAFRLRLKQENIWRFWHKKNRVWFSFFFFFLKNVPLDNPQEIWGNLWGISHNLSIRKIHGALKPAQKNQDVLSGCGQHQPGEWTPDGTGNLFHWRPVDAEEIWTSRGKGFKRWHV